MQLVAGSKIDAAFGAKLGLSTLAAAGLGNMVSDIAGVSMANRLEVLTFPLHPVPSVISNLHQGEGLGISLNGFLLPTGFCQC